MDFYSIFKLLHILAAMAWVGGGLTVMVAAFIASRQDDEGMLRVFGTVPSLGNFWFMPAALLTLIFGLAMTFVADLWSELWIILGLAGLFITLLTGHFVLRPIGMAMGALAAEGRIGDAAVEGRRMLQIAKFDYTLFFVIVADMVLKPSLTDFATIGAFAAVLVAAAVMFLPAAVRPQAPLPA